MDKKKTHWRKLDNPDYLGAYSLMDGEKRELVATIEKVVIEEVKTDRGSDPCKVAYIKGHKPMILNTTNSKIIANMYQSPYIEDWEDKKVTIYIATIKAFGESVECLRIRPTKPVTKLPELNPEHEKWDGAKLAIDSGTQTIEQIKVYFTISKSNEKLLCKNLK